MFTGIILGKGTVLEKRAAGSGMIFSLESDFDLTDPEEGESIAGHAVVPQGHTHSRNPP